MSDQESQNKGIPYSPNLPKETSLAEVRKYIADGLKEKTWKELSKINVGEEAFNMHIGDQLDHRRIEEETVLVKLSDGSMFDKDHFRWATPKDLIDILTAVILEHQQTHRASVLYIDPRERSTVVERFQELEKNGVGFTPEQQAKLNQIKVPDRIFSDFDDDSQLRTLGGGKNNKGELIEGGNKLLLQDIRQSLGVPCRVFWGWNLMKYADHKSLQKYNIPIPSPEEEKTIFQLMAAAFYALTGYEGYIDLVDVVDGYTPVYKKDTNGKYVTDKNNNLVREHNGYLHTGAFLNGWYEHCPLDK